MNDGDGEAVLSMATLRERFANPQELVGHSLYVSVTVLTESGVERDHRGHRGLGGTAVTHGAGASKGWGDTGLGTAKGEDRQGGGQQGRGHLRPPKARLGCSWEGMGSPGDMAIPCGHCRQRHGGGTA